MNNEHSETKTCRQCGVEQELSKFRVGSGKYGRLAKCKNCMSKTTKRKMTQDEIDSPTKLCRGCNDIKPKDKFAKDRTRIDGRQHYCKDCRTDKRSKQYHRNYYSEHRDDLLQYRKERYLNNRDAHRISMRNGYLRRTYGITTEEYESALIAQGGGCAICGTRPANGRNLAVDHNHKSGAIRGLLCDTCNRGVGLADDNIALMKEAILYLLSQKSDAA